MPRSPSPDRPAPGALATAAVLIGVLLGGLAMDAGGLDQASGPCPPGATCDGVATVDGQARFALSTRLDQPDARAHLTFGNPGDVPLIGDWDCDGEATPGMYRPSDGFVYLRNVNAAGFADLAYYFGDPGDVPLPGDFDGDGCDTVSLYRPSTGVVHVKDTLVEGVADYAFMFGNPGDRPFAGDFDGDGVDTVGLHRPSTGFVHLRNANAQGTADRSFFYGDPGDRVLAGDWDGDGDDTVAAYRPSTGTLYVKQANDPGHADHEVVLGAASVVLAAPNPPPVVLPAVSGPTTSASTTSVPATSTSSTSSTTSSSSTSSTTSTTTSSTTTTTTPTPEPVVMVAAGDIACDPASSSFNGGAGTDSACRQQATADLVAAIGPDVVAVLGDAQYADGTADQFAASYDPSWGAHLAVTRPAVGNHEYHLPGASDYFAYFGGAAGDPTEGYYGYDVGAWHVVVLNSNCEHVSCDAGSAQAAWLAADLAAHPASCTLAYQHHPRFSSGWHGDDPDVADLYEIIHDHGVDLLLAGHDHHYERLGRLAPDGARDGAGPNNFVVGTGGKSLRIGTVNPKPTTEAWADDTYGVLKLTLHETGFDWEFVSDGGTYSDSGSDTCN